MIKIIAGEKGEGKTKRLLEMANAAGKEVNGHVVFIDDDNRHMYDLHYDIRFVETSGFIMADQKVLFGFICGILSQDGDIEKIYIDGVKNIVKKMDSDDLDAFLDSLEELSAKANVDFTMIITGKRESFSEKAQSYFV
ncbi:MAG: twitching motility protein PilT [Clostridiales bacterium]|nr:twitching motility protein PilT [Clostridiales bacterium]